MSRAGGRARLARSAWAVSGRGQLACAPRARPSAGSGTWAPGSLRQSKCPCRGLALALPLVLCPAS
jgi:hypothetical protein